MYIRLRIILLQTIWMLSLTIPALAITSEVIPVAGGYFFQFSEILYPGSSEPVFTLYPETGKVSFGEGELGARPPAGQGIIATYRRGAGAVGNIYQLASDFHPFLIKWEEFFEDECDKLDVSLIVAGVKTLGVQTGETGVQVQAVALVPLPATLWLLGPMVVLGLWARRKQCRF